MYEVILSEMGAVFASYATIEWVLIRNVTRLTNRLSEVYCLFIWKTYMQYNMQHYQLSLQAVFLFTDTYYCYLLSLVVIFEQWTWYL